MNGVDDIRWRWIVDEEYPAWVELTLESGKRVLYKPAHQTSEPEPNEDESEASQSGNLPTGIR